MGGYWIWYLYWLPPLSGGLDKGIIRRIIRRIIRKGGEEEGYLSTKKSVSFYILSCIVVDFRYLLPV